MVSQYDDEIFSTLMDPYNGRAIKTLSPPLISPKVPSLTSYHIIYNFPYNDLTDDKSYVIGVSQCDNEIFSTLMDPYNGRAIKTLSPPLTSPKVPGLVIKAPSVPHCFRQRADIVSHHYTIHYN